MNPIYSSDRRSFLKTMLVAGVAPLVLPSGLLGQNAPSNKITLGFIGVGWQGVDLNLNSFLAEDDCVCSVVCDVYMGRATAAKKLVDDAYGNNDCRAVQDFRDVIDDPTIDGVVISTPDHWHTTMSLMALKAGKHVFCEKPTFTIGEGRTLVNAVKKSGLVFQTGLEDRSLIHYHRMVEWVRNGAIGDLHHMDVGVPEGAIHPWEEEHAVPDDLDWKLWLGPAPYHPYTATRTEPMHWRYIRDYSTGIITDWGCHLVDTAQFAANDPHQCALEVKGTAVPILEKAQSNIPANYDLHYRYSNGVTMQLHNVSKEEGLGKNVYIRFYGSKGWVSVTGWRGQFDASDSKILRKKYAPGKSKHYPLPDREHPNFLASIRTGAQPTYPAETLHRLSTTLHMGVIAADLERIVTWDPRKERFKNDKEANSKLTVEQNEDWKLG
jgi:predicted dehydrogenase